MGLPYFGSTEGGTRMEMIGISSYKGQSLRLLQMGIRIHQNLDHMTTAPYAVLRDIPLQFLKLNSGNTFNYPDAKISHLPAALAWRFPPGTGQVNLLWKHASRISCNVVVTFPMNSINTPHRAKPASFSLSLNPIMVI